MYHGGVEWSTYSSVIIYNASIDLGPLPYIYRSTPTLLSGNTTQSIKSTKAPAKEKPVAKAPSVTKAKKS